MAAAGVDPRFCAGLPRCAPDPRRGAQRSRPVGDCLGLCGGSARRSALPSGDDGGTCALCLQSGSLLVAPDRQGVRGKAGFCRGDRDAVPRFPHHQRFPQAASRSAERVVCPGAAAMPGSRAGQAGACCPGRTKIKANASKHKAMSYGRMVEAEPKLAAEVEEWMKKAGQTDAAEDGEHGGQRRGDEMPEWMANKQKRLAKIREAKAALEAEARAAETNAPADGGDASGPAGEVAATPAKPA